MNYKRVPRIISTLVGLIVGVILFDGFFYKPGRSGIFNLDVAIVANVIVVAFTYFIIFFIFRFVFKGGFKLNGLLIGLLFALSYSVGGVISFHFLNYIGFYKTTFYIPFIIIPIVAFGITKALDVILIRLVGCQN